MSKDDVAKKFSSHSAQWETFFSGDHDDAVCEVWPENWEALWVFDDIARCGLLRYFPMGGVAGIDWLQLKSHPGFKHRDISDEVIEIERAVVKQLLKKQ